MSDKKILFLMHEGVGATIFQSQVAVHALEMKRHGYDVEVWTYETSLKSFESSRRNVESFKRLGTLKIRLLRGVYVFLPFSAQVNAFILWCHLRLSTEKFDLIHARADYSAAVYSFIARLAGVPMLWDCRGDSYAETEQALAKRGRVPRLVQRTILRAVERQEALAGATCVAANFVSRLLEARKSRSLHGQPSFVIPCPVSSQYFHLDPRLRVERRAELGYAPDDLVLVYSGAMSTYQSFEAYVDLVGKMMRSGDVHVRLLIVTPDQDRARQYLAGRLPERVYRLRAAPYAAMNGYLNAADYGMLLRDQSPINDVASPTKFGEYCLAGLPVILDGNVQQTMEISTAIGNYESYADVANGKRLRPVDRTRRDAISFRARRFFSREYLNPEYARMYAAAIAMRPAAQRRREASGAHGASAERRT